MARSSLQPTVSVHTPKPDSHLRVASGYGCATYLWLLHNQRQMLATEQYDCAGTIMDFVVAAICDLAHPVTSDQLAASFGYFNVQSRTWNVDRLKSGGFPVNILPEVRRAGQVAGHLQQGLEHIPAGTPVLCAMGDMQCGVLSGAHNPSDATLNISTSIQLSVRVSDVPAGRAMGEAVEVVPFFDDVHLAVVAGLNGGNVFTALATLVKRWLQELGLGQDVIETALLEKLSSLGQSSPSDSTLKISPLSLVSDMTLIFWPALQESPPTMQHWVPCSERPQKALSTISSVSCPGGVGGKGVKRVVGSGSVLQNPLVLNRTQQVLAGKLDFVQGTESDAALGAAKAALAFMQRQQ